MQILLIEDETLLARNITRALERTGAVVRHAGSACDARSALLDGGYDLVIADISLGDGDGLDLLGEAAPILSQIPVIVMTGQDSVRNRARAEGLSVAAFLSKPFALSRLVELVSALLRTGAGTWAGGETRKQGSSVVMYSHDTIGLGHMRRNSAIARELVARVPDISVLMLVGCPAGMVFEPHPGIDYVKLPSLSKLGRGAYQAGSLRIDAQTTRDMRMRIIEGVIDSIRPDVFLVDHEPSGAMDELVSVLETLRARPNVRTVLGLRDILDEPARTRALWSDRGIEQLVASAYDHILVYGDDRFFPSVESYGLSALRPGNVSTCGIVTAVRPRRRLIPPETPKRVLVSGGGGRDAFPMISAAIAGIGILPEQKRPAMTVITGPLMDQELQNEAIRLGSRFGVEVLKAVTDLPSLMAQSDMLITMTGYNSINEALALGCPIVTVPRLGPSAEQRLRAEALERAGLAHYLRREDLSAESIARLLVSAPVVPQAARPNMDGVRNAARLIASMCATETSQKMEWAHA
ncbi:response regulator [Marivita sp.]|uniref:response regulator n=1 Tax=Marivita sp. TaxID=2003365 RepID=UPI002632E5D8|nr:response regulator [Marivita sp.]